MAPTNDYVEEIEKSKGKRLMACLDVKKRRGSRVEGGRVIQLPHLEVFLGRRERDLEGFGGVSITSNSLFLIPPNWRDLEGE